MNFSSSKKTKLYTYRYSRKATRFIISLIRYVFLITVGYIVLFPVISALSTAIKTENAFFDATLYWLPRNVTLDNFISAYNLLDYGNSLMRTLTLDVVSALIEVVTCAIVAYGFARFDFRFKKFFEFILMATIVIPTQIYIVSMVVNFKNVDFLGILSLLNKFTGIDLRFNILNTNLTFYLPSLLGIGLRSGILIFIYIQFFSGLPKELEEAAWIDGAGPFKTFYRIAIPSSGVVILTVTVFSLIWHWNDYFLGVMYISDNYPLAVQLASINSLLSVNNQFVGSSSTAIKGAITMAACLMFVLPILIVYLCVQNKFVKSIDRVGITG